MRETRFIDQNKQKWAEFEEVLRHDRKDPDKLSRLFVQVTDDLSYTRTFYPNRSVRVYLNALAQKIFFSIYKNKKEKGKRFLMFWKEELPMLIFQTRKELLISAAIFFFAVFIGAFSNANNPDFSKVVLGERYVEMTKNNIKKGDPMAVYNDPDEMEMFLRIMMNNLRVDFLSFISGIVFCIGTVYILLINGIMVGSFQYFFYEHGLLGQSMLSIWMHGTLEMTAAVVSGGAGLLLGRGLVFPGTYSRMQSFRITATRGVKILFGILPLTIFAAVIESYLTRYSKESDLLKGAIIFFSLLVVFGYFIWYPWMKSRRGFRYPQLDTRLPVARPAVIVLDEVKTNTDIFKDIFVFYRKYFRKIFIPAVLFMLFTAAAVYFLRHYFISSGEQVPAGGFSSIVDIFSYDRYPWFAWFNALFLSLSAFLVYRRLMRETGSGETGMEGVVNYARIFLLTGLVSLVMFIEGFTSILMLFILLPVAQLWMMIMVAEKKNIFTSAVRLVTLLGNSLLRLYGLFLLVSVLTVVLFFFINSPVIYLLSEAFDMNLSLDYATRRDVWSVIYSLINSLALYLIFPILFLSQAFTYFNLREINDADRLRSQVNAFPEGNPENKEA